MEWIQAVAFRFDVELDKNGDNSLNREEILGWIVPSNQDIATEEVSLLYERESKRCTVKDKSFLFFSKLMCEILSGPALDYRVPACSVVSHEQIYSHPAM